MKRRISFKRKCCKFDYDLTQPFDSLYKQTSRPGVCQINSVNLNLTARIQVQSLEYIGPFLYAFNICRNMLKVLKEILKQNTKLSPS
jgi:hypothetical protein